MSSDRGGLLKTRAESFARNLQNRLRNLSENEDTGWNDTASVGSDIYYDIDSSLASPEEEEAEPIFIASKNRESLLQRSDSEASTYFDTVEDVDALPACSSFVPTLKKIPLGLLQLRNEMLSNSFSYDAATTNGNTNGHAEDLELDEPISSRHVDQEVTENGNNLNINGCHENVEEFEPIHSYLSGVQIFESKTENNNEEVEINGVEEESIDVDVNCNYNMHQGDDDSSQHVDEHSENSNNQSCVFCDIEQIKTNLSNSNSLDDDSYEQTQNSDHQEERGETKEENTRINNTEEFVTDSPIISEKQPEKSFEKCLQTQSSEDETVSLQDLLTVLKEEISVENERRKSSENVQPLSETTLKLLRPSIEVTEASSSSSNESKTKVDDEFDLEEKRKHFRRCSSLKTGKTPPSTPGRKKIVRFADVLGLDLADVKTFLDEVPTIPMSAFEDLHGIDLTSSSNKIVIAVPQIEKILSPLFQQPCIQPNFLDRVRANNICLENAVVSDQTLFSITGLVRVKNIDFHKSVYVRYTLNGWKSFSDLQGRYVPNSCDGFSDKFSFTLYAHTLSIGQRLELAVRFHTAGGQFWDNNGGLNYVFECASLLPKSIAAPPLPSCPMETASFY